MSQHLIDEYMDQLVAGIERDRWASRRALQLAEDATEDEWDRCKALAEAEYDATHAEPVKPTRPHLRLVYSRD
jgi:hypothetical protein